MAYFPFEKLLVWQQAHTLCRKIFSLTKNFPLDERWKLVDQMTRAASSVPTNIVEGNGRYGKGDKRRYFNIAAASLEELRYHCLLAHDLEYLDPGEYEELQKQITSIGYLLYRLRCSLQK